MSRGARGREGASGALGSTAGLVVVDTEVTAELRAEGVTRDLIRLVQQARRDAGLQISDRIALTLGVPDTVRAQVEANRELLTEATLSTSLTWADGDTTVDLDGTPITVAVRRQPDH